jgi:hypothetical protein
MEIKALLTHNEFFHVWVLRECQKIHSLASLASSRDPPTSGVIVRPNGG